MKIRGKFIDFSPVIKAGISHEEKLIVGHGEHPLIVDSGFTGDMSVPSEILDLLDVEYSGTMPFQLADGKVVWKDLWYGWIVLGKYEYEALFIEGDFLLGMELASDLFSYFLVNFINKKVELEVGEV